jgi:hypothetical protein
MMSYRARSVSSVRPRYTRRNLLLRSVQETIKLTIFEGRERTVYLRSVTCCCHLHCGTVDGSGSEHVGFTGGGSKLALHATVSIM